MAVAALLIINSHLEDFYPRRWFAADGLLGVMIFYMLSGFGVQCSLLGRNQSFFDYIMRRIFRLYPALIIVAIATMLFFHAQLQSLSVKDWASILIWPTSYTYYKWILPFYIILFFVGQRATPARYIVILAILAVGYIISTLLEVFRPDFPTKLQLGNLSIFNQTMTYALGFFSGAALATIADRISPSLKQVILLTIAAGVSLVVYVAAKFTMVVGGHGAKCFFILHACVLLICITSFFITTWPPLLDRVRRAGPLWFVIALISTITLETYLIHEPLAHWETIAAIRFPLNILSLLAITVALSIPLHLITTLKPMKLK